MDDHLEVTHTLSFMVFLLMIVGIYWMVVLKLFGSIE